MIFGVDRTSEGKHPRIYNTKSRVLHLGSDYDQISMIHLIQECVPQYKGMSLFEMSCNNEFVRLESNSLLRYVISMIHIRRVSFYVGNSFEKIRDVSNESYRMWEKKRKQHLPADYKERFCEVAYKLKQYNGISLEELRGLINNSGTPLHESMIRILFFTDNGLYGETFEPMGSIDDHCYMHNSISLRGCVLSQKTQMQLYNIFHAHDMYMKDVEKNSIFTNGNFNPFSLTNLEVT